MATTSPSDASTALAEIPQGLGLGCRGEGPGELLARRDGELPVDVAEVPLDRLDRDDLALGDLAVRQAVRRQRRGPILACGERLASRQQPAVPPGPAARCDQLGMRAVRGARGAYARR